MDPSYLDYLYRLGEFNIKLGLDTIRSMLDRLGNPHHHPRIIHLAGTNGKGSTLKTLESLLLESGYTTGSTISPHLIFINERFRINGSSIDNERLNTAFRKVCRACDINLDLSSSVSRDGKLRPTFFEFLLAIAFVLFEAAKVDYILLETGLGGRLDATNVIEKPLACIITRIALDHQEYLGDTFEDITHEKLGILKNDSPVFVASQRETVTQTIKSHCYSHGYEFYSSPEDFYHKETSTDTRLFFRSLIYSNSSVSEWMEYSIKKFGLPGDHQKDNILTAIATYLFAVPKESQLDQEGVARVVENLRWSGRLQYLGKKNDILLDGAHNESGMKALLSYLTTFVLQKRVLFALGWMKNKELLGIFDLFCCDHFTFIPIEIDNDRSEKGEVVFQALQDKNLNVLQKGNCTELVVAKQVGSLPAHDLLVVAGSLYLVGEFLELWNRSERVD